MLFKNKKITLFVFLGMLILISGCLRIVPPTAAPTRQEGTVEECSGPIRSNIIDSILGKFNVRLLTNDRITANIGVDESLGDIDIAPWHPIGIKKSGDTYSFIDTGHYGLQYLVDVKINSCQVDANQLNLREDSADCILVDGTRPSTNEGNPVTGIAKAGLDLEASCPNNKFLKAVYHKGRIGLLDVDFHSDDYRILCCSENVIIK